MFTIDNPTYEEFQELAASGDFNPAFCFADYLEICRERRELREEAAREGWSAGYVEPPDLDDPEVQEIVQRMAERAARMITDYKQKAA